MPIRHRIAQVAQLVEQRTENPRVGGSNPPLGTTSNVHGPCFKVQVFEFTNHGSRTLDLTLKHLHPPHFYWQVMSFTVFVANTSRGPSTNGVNDIRGTLNGPQPIT